MMAKYWLHVKNGLVVGAMVSGRAAGDEEAEMLGEWVMQGVVPVLHDLGDAPLRIGHPVPVNPQLDLLAATAPSTPGAGGWRHAATMPTTGRFLAVVDGDVRIVGWGKASHVPIDGFLLLDQGVEDADLCAPECWQPLPAMGSAGGQSYQVRVNAWMMACFGETITADRTERSHRFLEETLELVQASGCTASEAHQLVDYVFGRETGEVHQEVGGVMVCLAALCTTHGIDQAEAGEVELRRVWTKVETIRAKHAAKPQFSPLPGTTPPGAEP